MSQSFENFQAARRPVVAVPPPRSAADLLPIVPGVIVDPPPHVAAKLERLGWKTGDPVPGNLSQIVERIKQDAIDSGRLPVDPDTPPLTPDVIEIEDLPEADQERIRRVILETKHAAKTLEAVKGLNPSIASALQTATQAEVKDRLSGPVQLGVPAGAMAAGPPRGAKFEAPDLAAQVRAVRGGTEKATEPAPEPVKEPEKEPAKLKSPNCPNCGWHLERDDFIEVTREDKIAYLAVVLSCDATNRFVKTVSLFDGALKLTFKTLTVDEAKLALQQVGDDVKVGKIDGRLEFMNVHQEYRLVMTLDAIEIQDRGLVRLPAAIEQKPTDNVTALPDILAWLRAEVVVAEHLWMVITEEFFRFQRLTERLEVNAGNADFYNGIRLPR